MPRPYQTGDNGGATMSGRTYEPQVTPWNRNDDDVRVTDGRYGGNYSSASHPADDRYRNDRQYYGRQDSRAGRGDAWDRRDLQPSYEQAYDRDRQRYGDDRYDRDGHREQRADHNDHNRHDQGRHDYDRDLIGNGHRNDRDRHENERRADERRAQHVDDRDRDTYGRGRDYQRVNRAVNGPSYDRDFSNGRRGEITSRAYNPDREDNRSREDRPWAGFADSWNRNR